MKIKRNVTAVPAQKIYAVISKNYTDENILYLKNWIRVLIWNSVAFKCNREYFGTKELIRCIFTICLRLI